MKTFITKTALAIVLCVLTFACSTPRHTNLSTGQKMYVVDEDVFNMRAVRLSDSTVRISFVGTPTLRTHGRTIGFVEIYIGPDAENITDTLAVATDYTTSPDNNQTMLLVGEASWDTYAAKTSKHAAMEVVIVTGPEAIMFKTVKEYEQAEPMELIPFTTAQSDTLVDIGVIARRIFVPPGEHLPSSENLRIIISNEQGQVVYRSDVGQQFLSIVTVLEPQTSNQMQRYAAPWSGQTLSGNRAPAGTYKAEIIIPARPKAYSASTTFEWNP